MLFSMGASNIVSVLVLLSLHILCALRLQPAEAQSWVKVAYWYSGSEFPISDINSALFTHLIYEFAGINSSSYELSVSSSEEQFYSSFTHTVKGKNPSITTLVSIGGGEADYSVVSNLVSNVSHRKSFIDSSIMLARAYGFQGLDLCWVSANTSSDMTNMGALFQEWRAAIISEATNSSHEQLILTAAVQYKPDLESFSFPVESIQNNLNWVHVMAYDYYGPEWTNFIGAHAALYDPASDASTDYGIKAWIGEGLPASKLVLGLPFYGYAWKLANPSDNSIGAPATGPAITKHGSMSYKDIEGYIERYGADIIYNTTYVAKYCVIGTTWIGFDDAEVVKVKVSYAKEQSLLGYFVWQVPYDDNWVLSLAAEASTESEDQIDHISEAVGYELMEEPEEVSEELNIQQVKKCYEPNSKTKHDAEKVAIELLATRASTAVELRKKLCGKKFSLDIVEAVVNDFISRGLLNDSLYAEAFSRSRWSSSSWGPRRIKQALFNKGVSSVVAEKAIKLVFEEGESDKDEELIHGLSKLSMDNLFVQASKQWLRGQEVPKETRKARIVRWLQYRGFSWGVISFILKKLESQYPP